MILKKIINFPPLIIIESYLKELASWKGWLDEDNKNIADLSQLPEDRKKKLDMGEFGVEGSFRKLGVD